MKIDNIELLNLLYEYPAEHAFDYAGGTCTGRLTSLVFVHTDSGHTGIGSAYTHPGLAHITVKQQLEPLLIGEDPRDVEMLWDKMYRVTRWYGRKGAAMTALGALDTAFWDLRGLALGKPLWLLLGAEQSRCPAYASALLWNNLDGLTREASGLIDQGFRRVKMRLGRNEQYDCQAVQAVRGAIGNENDLMVDASMRYNVRLARRIGNVLAENRVFWFEEPFAPEDLDSYKQLHGTIDVPLAAGENEFGTQGFQELIRTGAVDIVQPDAGRCGGISEVRRVGKIATEAGLRIATHTWNDAVTLIANAHVISSMPQGITVEIDKTGNPFIEELLVEPLQVNEGNLKLSDKPGLGIEINRTTLEKYRLVDPFGIPDGNYSDMLFGKAHYSPPEPYQETF